MRVMTTRMSQPVVRRPNLPLTATDEAELAQLRDSPELRASLAAMVASAPNVEGDVSEAVLLHAVLEAGFAAVRAHQEAAGYQQLAADYVGDSQQRRRMSRRRSPVWANES